MAFVFNISLYSLNMNFRVGLPLNKLNQTLSRQLHKRQKTHYYATSDDDDDDDDDYDDDDDDYYYYYYEYD